MKNNKPLDEGQIIVLNNNDLKIVADITLNIGYIITNKDKDSYYTIETENAGTGNYISIYEDENEEHKVSINNFKELEIIINDFKERYKKVVPNTKL